MAKDAMKAADADALKKSIGFFLSFEETDV
jgi:hypothetical protein